MDKEREIIKLYSGNQEEQISSILKNDLSIPLHRFRNQKLFTGNYCIVIRNSKVLHFTCLHNNIKLTELTLTYCKAIEELQFQELINSQNKDGFTALHMASFKGNIDIINLLLSNGADQNAKNATGLSMLHMAVQGDHVKASLFWINRGISIDIPDSTNQTPLICASFLGSQQMVNFLIPWGAQLNKQTKDKGYSALHVATQQGHSRIVRKLLVKGIDRNLKDRCGKTAMDLAIESRFSSIQTMIVRSIHNQENKLGIAERCGLRQPNSKIEKNYTSMILYLFLYCSSFILTMLFSQRGTLYYWFIITCTLTLLLTLLIVRKNPGYVALPNKQLMELLENNSAEALCPECSLVRPPRSRHCEICGKCVNRYDHHCPWLNNCIGEKNLYIFMLFLFVLVISMVLEIIIQCQFKLETYTSQITFYYTMILSCLFIIPVMLLLTVQIYNLMKGQTTYERHLQKQGLDRIQSRKASAEQLRKSAETNESEFRFKKPLLKETELIL